MVRTDLGHHLRHHCLRRLEVERRLAEIRVLRASETHQTLAAHADWDAYFADARRRLEEECAEMRRKLEEDEDDR